MTLNRFRGSACALLLALPAAAQAESGDTPPLPDRNPSARPRHRRRSTAGAAGRPPTVAWTDAEVAAAKADCAKLLAGVALDYEPLPPIKEGICGAPAPILRQVDRQRSGGRASIRRRP